MTIPTNIQQAIQAYYAERATPDQIAALEEWFREDEAHIKVFAEHGIIEWQVRCEHEKLDAAAVLSILREAEENAEPKLVLLKANDSNASAPRIDEQPLTAREIISLCGYILAQALRSRPAVVGSIAAALLLAAAVSVSLYVVGSDDQPGIAHDATAKSTESTLPTNDTNTLSIVATLTAEHDAVWDRRPGQDLYAGQRLTLTHGFAEITTARGARAIIEAPATIELLDNDNAIRLHTGKLVGICETESSKGFLVRTPQMDITDLGTRFGIQIAQDAVTQIHVIEGTVSATQLGNRGPSSSGIRLSAGDALRGLSDGDLAQIDFDFNQFVYDMPRQGSPPRVEGDLAIYSEAVPADLTWGLSARRELQIYREQTGLILEQDLQTDPKATIPAGQAVDVFLLHLDTGRPEQFVGRYIIHFDRPVLGVIISESQLIETDRLLGVPGVQYPLETSSYLEFAKNNPNARRGFEPPANENTDSALIDGSTLTLTMSASQYIDQVRVIVQSQTPEANLERAGDFPPNH